MQGEYPAEGGVRLCRACDAELWTFKIFAFTCELFFDPATARVLLSWWETRVGAAGAVDQGQFDPAALLAALKTLV